MEPQIIDRLFTRLEQSVDRLTERIELLDKAIIAATHPLESRISGLETETAKFKMIVSALAIVSGTITTAGLFHSK
jgi:hypothetical protein